MDRMEQLAATIAELTDHDGTYATAIPGVYLSRLTSTCGSRHTVDRAVFCIVAQGAKSVLLNDKRYRQDSSQYFVITLDLPLVGQIEEASRKRPFLGFSMELDVPEISSLILECDLPLHPMPHNERSFFVSPMNEDLLDAVLRLTRLLKTPSQLPILSPLIRREIFYRLLLNDEGALLRRMTVENGQVQRIAGAVEWLKRNVSKPIRMEKLAREVHMSPSRMHSWFKAVTNMTPVQFHKQLRLQEARRILLSETTDVITTSQRVGYESPSQFSREYRRLFGSPPMRDIQQLRNNGETPMLPPKAVVNARRIDNPF
jgi:AraC-like DNA-binding protein